MDYDKLSSEKVNYLIWRYLQEAGFGQCAARLQREWGISDPDQLSFAKHIGPHSLIQLLHSGLKLHRISNRDRVGGAVLFFGPERQPGISTETQTTNKQPSSPGRKADGESSVNGLYPENAAPQAPAAKGRGRRSNVAVNGKPKSGEAMNVDENGIPTPKMEHEMEITDEDSSTNKPAVADAGANATSEDVDGGSNHGLESGASHLDMHSHLEGQEQQQHPHQQQLIPTLANGTSVGVQSDKVTDLASETAVLSLPGKNVNHATWNPNQHGLLAAGGRALGRIWRIYESTRSGLDDAQATSPATSPSTTAKSFASPEDTMDLTVDSNSSVVSMAWSPDGENVAYSTFSDDMLVTKRSYVFIKDIHGQELDSFPSGPEPVTNLAWSPNGRCIAALIGRSVVVYDVKMSLGALPLKLQPWLYDVAWIDHNQLIICGESLIATIRVVDNKLIMGQSFGPFSQPHDWTNLRVDPITSSVAIVSENSCHLALIQDTSSLYCERAHESTITSLVYQPLYDRDGMDPAEQRLLATASIDETIKLWDTASGLQHIRTFDMGLSSPALAISFSPDGQTLSGATWNKILLWNIENGTMPKAKWELKHVDWPSQLPNGSSHTNGINGYAHDVNMEDDNDEPPVLGWEKAGRYLSFAHKDNIAVITIQR